MTDRVSAVDFYLDMPAAELAAFEQRVRAEPDVEPGHPFRREAKARLLARIAAVRQMRGEQVAG